MARLAASTLKALFAVHALVCCAPESTPERQTAELIFDRDTRLDHAFVRPDWQTLGGSVAMVVEKSALVRTATGWALSPQGALGPVRKLAQALTGYDMCSFERFKDDVMIDAIASAVAVGPRMMITAGHISEGNCPDAYFLFGFHTLDTFGNTPTDFPAHAVHECDEVVLWRDDDHADLLVFRTKHPMVTIAGLPLPATPPRVGDPVVSIGHPLGTAQKFHQGTIRRVRGGWIDTDNAAIEGNSGGAIIRLTDGALLGISSASWGQTFNAPVNSQCATYFRCPRTTGCRLSNGTYAFAEASNLFVHFDQSLVSRSSTCPLD